MMYGRKEERKKNRKPVREIESKEKKKENKTKQKKGRVERKKEERQGRKKSNYKFQPMNEMMEQKSDK